MTEKAKPSPFPAQVWNTLRKQEGQVQSLTERKGNFDYLSWANAWTILMDHFPCSEFEIPEPTVLQNGTVMVYTTVTVSDGNSSLKRSMHLPVMNNQNKPIPDPTTRDINDAVMRCLVKNLGLFGLGLDLYRKELGVSETKIVPEKPLATDKQKAEIQEWIESGKLSDDQVAWLEQRADTLTFNQAKNALAKFNARESE